MKEWYIKINNHEEGPFTLAQLKRDMRITPDTLVWKKGFKRWKQIREVKELSKLFKDEEKPPEKKKKGDNGSKIKKGDEVIAIPYDPFQFWWLLVILILLVFYTLYRANTN